MQKVNVKVHKYASVVLRKISRNNRPMKTDRINLIIFGIL